MRITLVHNPKAGDQRHGKKDLMAQLAEAGHHAVYQSTKKHSYKKALKEPTDLVLAAGGDGTIGKVASQLIDTGIPLTALPLGTANNLARTLGFTGSPSEIIGRLKDGKKRTFDVGIVSGPFGENYFFESTGGGLLADYLSAADKEKKNKLPKLTPEQEIARHVSQLRQRLHDYEPQKWKIAIDDKNISDRYILWEAMNIRSVGPALYLATEAATRDGRLDFVCVHERDRPLILKYLDAKLAGKKQKFPLPVRKFRKLKVTGKKSRIHFDDNLWPDMDKKKADVKIEIAVKPSALVVLDLSRAV
jgi:diacylglycerol kinase (ATP)